MDWLAWLLKRESRKGEIPSVRSIQFDASGWTPTKTGNGSLEWRNSDGDTLRAGFCHKLSDLTLALLTSIP
jgi:hypothetical protein